MYGTGKLMPPPGLTESAPHTDGRIALDKVTYRMAQTATDCFAVSRSGNISYKHIGQYRSVVEARQAAEQDREFAGTALANDLTRQAREETERRRQHEAEIAAVQA